MGLVGLLFQEEKTARHRKLTSGQMLQFGSTLASAKNGSQTQCGFQKLNRHVSSQVLDEKESQIYIYTVAGDLTTPLTDKLELSYTNSVRVVPSHLRLPLPCVVAVQASHTCLLCLRGNEVP